MKQKLFDTDIAISKGGRVQRYWMMKVMHPKFAAEEAKANNEVDMVAILKAYKVKAFEFGNWVSQNDRYDFVHAFVHSAELLSDIVGSKNLGLDLLLGVAFGARGRGGGAIAHYEPGHNVINLTRDKSYGCLAHEWAHAIDYNLGRHVDQNKDYSYLTGGRSIACILPENTGAQLRYWANAVVDEAKATESFARLKNADEYWHRRTEVWARYFEQYIAYQCMLKKKSPRFLAMTFSDYCGRPEYWKEDEFKQIARGSMFSFIAVLKGVLNDRYHLTACPYKYKTRDAIGAKPEPPKVKPLKVEKPKKAAATPKPKTVTTSTSKKETTKAKPEVEMKLTPRHFWTVWFDGDTVRVRKTIFSDHYHIAGHAKGLSFEKVECECHTVNDKYLHRTSKTTGEYWLKEYVKSDKKHYKEAIKRGEYSTYNDVIKKVEGRDWYFRDINDAERFAKKHLPEGGKYIEYNVSEENWRHMLDIISGRIKIK